MVKCSEVYLFWDVSHGLDFYVRIHFIFFTVFLSEFVRRLDMDNIKCMNQIKIAKRDLLLLF